MDSNTNQRGYFTTNDKSITIMPSTRKDVAKRAGSNFNPNFNVATSFKLPVKKFSEEEVLIEGLTTQRKLPFTPFRKEEGVIESKQTLNNFSFNIFKDAQQNQKMSSAFMENYDSNKENSSFFSNSIFNSGNKEASHSKAADSEFKIPMKKTLFPDSKEKKTLINSVKCNLQLSFNLREPSGLFDQEKRNLFTNTLISSSSCSSSDNMQNSSQLSQTSQSSQISTIEQGLQAEKEKLKIKENEGGKQINKLVKNLINPQETGFNMVNPFLPEPSVKNCENSQKTVTDSLMENFNNKSNLLVPVDRSNDEKYKLLALKKVRKPTFKDNKSTSNADVMMETQDSMLQMDFYTQKRKKVVHSVQKKYMSEIYLTDPLTGEKKAFRILQDSEVGFNQYWQGFIRETQADEDVPSDDEVIERATRHNEKNLMEALEQVMVRKEYHLVNNLSLLMDR